MLQRATIGSLSLLAAATAQAGPDLLTGVLDTAGSAGLGSIVRVEKSPYVGAGTRYDLVPLYLYEGSRFFVHASRLGMKLHADQSDRLDLFVERRFEGLLEDDIPPKLAGLGARSASFDLGLSYRMRQSWGTLQAAMQRDIGNASKGTEASLSYAYDWRNGRLVLRPSITLTWRDAALNNYYYGVRPEETTTDRPAYAPGSGMDGSLGLYVSYDLTENWRVLGGVSTSLQDSKVRRSSIVRQGSQPTISLGAVYDFGSYRDGWAGERTPTTIKVFHGQASAEGCHLARIMTFKCSDTNKLHPTSITGIHVGKSFVQGFNGWPLDFTGFAGLVYHDDKGLQRNGAQFDLYMKGYYYGFPWSDWVRTRLGMGFGLSIAQRVPYEEVSSQAARNRSTSRLLNYLDPTIDFNVGDVFRAKSLKTTYLGVGVSHRSGIFASSQLLGNVNGGSNYIYSYLETTF
ncbi:MipA/OmpV family protein [Chitinimonas naiadis]